MSGAGNSNKQIDSSDDEDIPLVKRFGLASPVANGGGAGTHELSRAGHLANQVQNNGGIRVTVKRELSSSPANSSLPATPKNGSRRSSKARRELSDDDADGAPHGVNGTGALPPLKKMKKFDSDSEEDAPLIQQFSASKEVKIKSDPDAENDSRASSVSLKQSQRAQRKNVKREAKQVRKIKKEKVQRGAEAELEDEEEDAEEYKWWKNANNVDDTVKWQTLSHNGVYFAPPYVPLPKNVKFLYEGKPVSLPPEAEEVAGFFAQILETDYAVNPTFIKNFFHDFRRVLAAYPELVFIAEFEKCDFTQMHKHFVEQKEVRKRMTKEEKEAIKQEKLKIEEKYGWALMDGRREKVGNFRIEIPGLFRGRGSHPKTGCLKKRVTPEQITINIGAEAKVPVPPPGHRWGNVVHDNKVTWLAMWKENVNDNIKYVFLGATSSLKGLSDMKKFEKARELKKHVKRIRADYTRELQDRLMATRQRATAMYLIDRFALRAGNEKGEDEADTVGCCSLRFEHITLDPPNKVTFDFLGKDSIRYFNEVEVDRQVFKNLKLFKKPPKKEGDPLFDRLTTSSLNKHLSTYMDGLTAKVFRTFNASYTFQDELKQTPENASVAEKMLAYNRANRQVAILCNHQRSVSKSFGTQMTRMDERIKALKYQRWTLKKQMVKLDSSLKRKRPELLAAESDLDDEFVKSYELLLKEKEKEKRAKDFEKYNAKRKEEGKPTVKLSEMPVRAKAEPSMERLEKQYSTLTERLRAMKLQKVDKDENKTTALGTSKTNYIDPRISAAWCKKYDVPIEKIFNRSLREKFEWAVEVEKDYQF